MPGDHLPVQASKYTLDFPTGQAYKAAYLWHGVPEGYD